MNAEEADHSSKLAAKASPFPLIPISRPQVLFHPKHPKSRFWMGDYGFNRQLNLLVRGTIFLEWDTVFKVGFPGVATIGVLRGFKVGMWDGGIAINLHQVQTILHVGMACSQAQLPARYGSTSNSRVDSKPTLRRASPAPNRRPR